MPIYKLEQWLFIAALFASVGCAAIPTPLPFQTADNACNAPWENTTCQDECDNSTVCMTDCSYFTSYGKNFAKDLNQEITVDINGD